MNVRVAAFAPAVILVTPPAFAEPPVDSALAPPGGQIEAHAHFGVATTPFDVTTLREAKGQAFVFLAGARYALSAPLSFELRAPLVLGSVAQPAGSYVDATALGNPQIGARYGFIERHCRESAFALSAALEIGAPLASHGANLMPNRVLAIADGIEGRGHSEWFTPGVVPITASTALRWTSAPWSLAAELRAPLFLRVSDADLPSATTRTNALGLATTFGVEARFRLSRRFSLASAAHLFFDVVPPVEHVRRVARAQDFERLSLFVHFGASVALAVDLQTALGWELGGSTVGGGLRVAMNL